MTTVRRAARTTGSLALYLALAVLLFSQACVDDPTATDFESGTNEDSAPAGPEATGQANYPAPPGGARDFSSAGSGSQPGVDSAALERGRRYWEAMTDSARAEALEAFDSLVVPLLLETIETIADGDTSYGGQPTGSLQVVAGSGPTGSATGNNKDSDGDGLRDGFERALAKGFMPAYRVSAEERDTIGFAEFYDERTQRVKATYGSTPVRSKYRVHPLGFRTTLTGVQYGFVQVDYLTLWNGDIGLQVKCRDLVWSLANGFFTRFIAAIAPPHVLDNEWSSMLVAAPTVLTDSGTVAYDPNAYAYRAYWVRTSAHEDTFTDATMYWPHEPGGIRLGYHTYLWLAKDKHGTYAFNPNRYPLLGKYFWIWYLDLLQARKLYRITQRWFDIFLNILDNLVFGCIVENFIDQGRAKVTEPKNVGELSNPADGFLYILDTSDGKSRLGYKLAKDIWGWYLDNFGNTWAAAEATRRSAR